MLNFLIRHREVAIAGVKGFKRQPLTPKLFGLMAEYTTKSKIAQANPWRRTGAPTAGFPIEFLLAFDIFPIHPEAYACYAGAAGITQAAIEHAEGMGYSRDLCSYMKTSIGATELGYPCDFGGVPQPDLYTSANMVCDTHIKWMENEARRHNLPYFGLDVPSHVAGSDDQSLERDIDYLVAQFFDLIAFLEKQTGKTFAQDKFMRVIGKSQEACRLYDEILQYRRCLPAAQYFEFQRLFMLPVAVMWNLDGCIRYYRRILRKLKQRFGPTPPADLGGREKFRLIWEGITIWYKVDLYYWLAERGAHFVYEQYTESFAIRRRRTGTFDETLRQIARELLLLPYTLNLEKRIANFERKIDEYDIDGVVLHANLSCRPASAAQQDVKQALQESRNIPVLILSADMDDPRSFAEGPVKTRLESFIEMMAANRDRRSEKQIETQ